MLLTYPLMVAIQEISGRIGRVTGHGIAGNVCRNYGPAYVWSLVVRSPMLAIPARHAALASDGVSPPITAYSG
jgi:Mn2+/Fe2+ NRAMP family transporter